MKIKNYLKKLAKNIKGFTLVEMLVTVIILGLLSGVAIVSVTSTLTKSHKEYDQKQNELFTTSAQSYYQDNRVMLTNLKLLNTSEVNLQTLIDQNYIDKVVDYKKKEYDYQKSKAYVKKTGTGKYIYYSELYGKDGKLRVTNKPIDNKKSSGITIEIKNYKNATSQAYSEKDKIYYVNDKIDIDIYLKGGISSYQYYIKRGDKNYKKSGEIGVDKEEYSDTIKLDVKDFANGSYKLEVVAYGYDGGVTSKQGATIVVDKITPKCSISLDGTKGNNVDGIQWYKAGPLSAKMSVKETNKYKYTLTLEQLTNINYRSSNTSDIEELPITEDIENVYAYGYLQDKAGNIGECKLDTPIYYDKTLPVCSITLDGTKGNRVDGIQWYKAGDLTAKMKITEKNKYKYSLGLDELKNINYKDGTNENYDLPIKEEIENRYAYGYVQDKAGNEGSCKPAEPIYYDKTLPKCKLSLDGKKGNNVDGKQWYIRKDDNTRLNVVINITDNNRYKYSIGLDTNKNYTNGNSEKYKLPLPLETNQISSTAYGYAQDKAGNEGSCQTTTPIYYDGTLPTCTIEKSSDMQKPNGKNGWYITPVTLQLKTSDTGSGIRNDNSSGNSGYDISTKYFEKASDISTYNNCPNLSNCTITQGDTPSKGVTWYGYVSDKAGNKNKCSSSLLKVDTTKPTCSISIIKGTKGRIGNGETGWYTSDVNLQLTTKDTGSGIRNDNSSGNTGYDISTKYFEKASDISTYNNCPNLSNCTVKQGNTTSSGVTWYGYVSDIAGNKNKCNSSLIKVDKSTPSVLITNKHNSDWVNYNYQMKVSISGIGSSGVYLYGYYIGDAYGPPIHTYGPGTKSSVEYTTNSFKTEMKKTRVYYAISGAGNISNVDTTLVYIDKTPPTFSKTCYCENTKCISCGSKYNYVLKYKLYDSLSGLDSTEGWAWNSSGGTKMTNHESENLYSVGKSTYYGYIGVSKAGGSFKCEKLCDNAGNCTPVSDIVSASSECPEKAYCNSHSS